MIKKLCKQDPTQWHDWYAWYPVWTPEVKVDDRLCQTRMWRVVVQRQYHFYWGDGSWEYRVKEGA